MHRHLTLLVLLIAPVAAAQTAACGDCDLNGSVSIVDALAAAQSAAASNG